MGPKKDAKETPTDSGAGAKFADILVGQRSIPCKLRVNLNCNVEILLDAVKKEMVKKLDERINALRSVIESDQVVGSESGGSPSDVHPNNDIISKLMHFQSQIKNECGNMDLLLNGAAVGCNTVRFIYHLFLLTLIILIFIYKSLQKLNSIAMNDVLVHGAVYVLGVVDQETGAAPEAFIIEDVVERPPSGAPTKKK